MRFLIWLSRIVIALMLLGAGLWGALALYYRLPQEENLRIAAGALFGLAGLLAAIAILRGRWLSLMIFGLGLTLLVSWWITILPSNDRNWAPVVARQPALAIVNDQLIVRNLRNFTWRSETDFTPRWEDRIYELNKIEGVDLFFSYWAGPTIAHVIVSFTFTNALPLAFSIEIRREQAEDYSAVAGFFKHYELFILAADERDVIRLRTNVWKEDVQLYRLGVSREKARALINGYVSEINSLSVTPRWYDTLGANCTTIAFRLAQALWPNLRFDWRVIASGYGPDYAYDIGAVDTRLPLADLKEKAKITQKAQAAGDRPEFSALIRQGIPRPAQ
jgi:hypothetical protein